jgi:hypothetical protein
MWREGYLVFVSKPPNRKATAMSRIMRVEFTLVGHFDDSTYALPLFFEGEPVAGEISTKFAEYLSATGKTWDDVRILSLADV